MKISIITVCLNARDMIEDCVNSIHGQDYPVEHIIVDGGSTDGTQEIIMRHQKRVKVFISEKDRGIYDAMNKGILRSSGEVVGILNADDCYAHANVLSKVAHTFTGNVDSCYGDLVYVSRYNLENVTRYWRSGGYNKNAFYRGWMPPHPAFFIRRSVYNKFGLYNLDLGSSADYELMLRFLLRYEISSAYIPEVLVRMRSGGVSNESLRNRLIANRMDRKAWQVNGIKPYPWTLLLKPIRKTGQWLFKA